MNLWSLDMIYKSYNVQRHGNNNSNNYYYKIIPTNIYGIMLKMHSILFNTMCI